MLFPVYFLSVQCMDQPHLPLSHIQHEFEDYQFLLPALDSCVKYVHRHKVSNLCMYEIRISMSEGLLKVYIAAAVTAR